MIPCKDSVDVFDELERLMEGKYELATLISVKEELVNISENLKGKDKIAAQVGLALLEKKNVRLIESVKTQGGVDNEILAVAGASKGDFIVCTNDRELRKRLKAGGIPVISLRGKSHLDYV